MQQNIQTELDFSSTPAGEAREAGREETESLSTANDPESPASTNRLMEEVCERGNLKEAYSKCASRWTRTGYKALVSDERVTYREVRIHQRCEA